MRLTCLLIIIPTLAISAKGYSQKISLSFSNVSVEKLLGEIRQQTGYSFLWNEHTFQDLPPKSVSVHEASLEEAVNACLKGLPLTYAIHGKVVFIERSIVPSMRIKPTVLPPLSPLNVVVGLVTERSGAPLPGVTVVVKNKPSVGTTTDLNGRFVLEVPDNAVLLFSMVGFEQREIPVAGKSVVNVTLRPAVSTLDETVIVAFGSQKKEDVVGAVTSISPSELKVPASNLTTALAGRLSGVIAYQRSGEPGQDNADFFIRGVTTFGYKKDPLILIDGIESTTTDLARLQTDNIANFSILKDATASALYGSRAANGVILIRTKEGQEGKAKISLRLENSVSMPTRNIALADPVTYMRLNNEAVRSRDPLGRLPYSDQKIDNTLSGVNPYAYPATDWRQALIKRYTTNQRANLNVSGGGKVARYYVAGAVNKDNGIMKVDPQNNFNSNIKLITYTLRSNVNVNITSSTELAVRLSGTFDDYSGPLDGGTGLYNKIMKTNPVLFPAYYPRDKDHDYVKHILFGNYDDGGGKYYLNPYADMVKGYKNYSRSTVSAQFEVKQDLALLTEGLNIKMLINTKRYSYFDVTRSYKPFWYEAGSYDKRDNTYMLNLLNEDSGTEYLDYDPGAKTVQASFYMQSTLDYDRTFNDRHIVNGLLVFMAQNRLTGNPTDLQSSLPFRNLGLAGRATYSFDHRYYAEFDFGYNASERFYKSHRWGFFPSFGLAWNISNEKFWSFAKSSISNLKLRATYGLTGNDDIGSAQDRFLYLSNVNMNDNSRGASFGRDNKYSLSGISVSRYSNPNVTWERAAKTNVGFDMELFGRWNLIADFYKETRSNILMPRASIPDEMGLSAQPQANIGKAEGKGIDVSLDFKQSFPNTLWLEARANFTYAASKFLVYEEYDYQDEPWKSHIGHSVGQQWGYLGERLFIDDAEAAKSPRQNFGGYGGGDIKYHDVNGDGYITALDEVPIGFPTTPEIVYGFGFSMGYKHFDFSAFFQGLGRESFWIDAAATAPFVPGDNLGNFVSQNQLLKAYADDHWSETHENLYALWPRLSTSSVGNDNNFEKSTWFMRNGSFLRLKQVEFGYTLPGKAAQRIFMNNLRIYVNSTNPFCWSAFKLWDVEMAGNGLGYPVQKVFNIGVLLSF